MKIEKYLHMQSMEANYLARGVLGSATIVLTDEHILTMSDPGPTTVKLALPIQVAVRASPHHPVKVTIEFEEDA